MEDNETTGFASESATVRIHFSSTYGAGHDGPKDVPEGTTVERLFNQELPGMSPDNFFIRMNRQPGAVPGNRVLMEGDRVSVNPKKTKGA